MYVFSHRSLVLLYILPRNNSNINSFRVLRLDLICSYYVISYTPIYAMKLPGPRWSPGHGESCYSSHMAQGKLKTQKIPYSEQEKIHMGEGLGGVELNRQDPPLLSLWVRLRTTSSHVNLSELVHSFTYPLYFSGSSLLLAGGRPPHHPVNSNPLALF